MNTTYLDDQHFLHTFKQHWEKCRNAAYYYPASVMWRCMLVKRRIRLLFSCASAERCREREVMEHFYYSTMYDVLHDVKDTGDKALALKNMKVKNV